MDITQAFIIGILVLLIYLVLAFTYHVYKLEILVRYLCNEKQSVDNFFDSLEAKANKKKCKNCNRNDNTCGCN